MRVSRWFLLAVAAGVLAVPAISQSTKLIHPSDYPAWSRGSDGEVEIVLRSVKIKREGGKVFYHGTGDWNPTNEAEAERTVMAYSTEPASLTDLKRWMGTAKVNDRIVVQIYPDDPPSTVEKVGDTYVSTQDFYTQTLSADDMQRFVASEAAKQNLTECKSNLKNLGVALEMYSTDYSGRYPADWGLLTPNYLKVIMACPGAQKDTYSATYRVSANPDAYTFYCQGHHHQDAGNGTNFPQYNSYEGLIERR